MLKLRSRLVLAAGCTAAISLASLATPALAAGSVLSVSQGTLLAKGAGVSTSVTFSCDVGQTYDLGVNLRQNVKGGRIATGSAFSSSREDCTGEAQTESLVIPADSVAFKKGSAVAQVFLGTCNPDFSSCQQDQLTTEIRIR